MYTNRTIMDFTGFTLCSVANPHGFCNKCMKTTAKIEHR